MHYSQKQVSHKGLLAQLALLFKMINSFGINVAPKIDESDENLAPKPTGALTVDSVLAASVPALAHTNQDIKNASIKIVLDV